MKLGDTRVSTTDQTPAWPLAALKREQCEKICTDKASGAPRARPALDTCLQRRTADPLQRSLFQRLERLGLPMPVPSRDHPLALPGEAAIFEGEPRRERSQRGETNEEIQGRLDHAPSRRPEVG
jgi:Resolvase, N terminal domain